MIRDTTKGLSMRINCLEKNSSKYSSNAYLIRGDKNCLEDVNTLIDTGVDGSVVGFVRSVYTGVGKKPVEQVILTHCHFDHIGGVSAVKEEFNALVLGFGHNHPVEKTLRDGQVIRIGDRDCTIIHCIEHSSDSVLVYEPREGILFSGDTPLDIKSDGGEYHKAYLKVLERLINFNISLIYPGHGPPIEKAHEVISRTYKIVSNSKLI